MRRDLYLVMNKDRGTCLAQRTERAQSTWKRMKGLIGRPVQAFPDGSGLWLAPCNGIHTIGMRYPIDVAYLDSQKRVLQSYHRLAPFRFGSLRLRARSVLELPAGTLERTHTEVGDSLEIRPVGTAAD